MANQVGIVGTGQTALGAANGQSASELIYRAASNAVADAGIDFDAIDGLITVPGRGDLSGASCTVLASYLGLTPEFLSTIDIAGASGCAMVDYAAMAIRAGLATRVLCVAGDNSLSSLARSGTVARISGGGGVNDCYEAPLGPTVPSLYAMAATRHMAEYGTTNEQLASVAVATRMHAGLNDEAFKRDPIDVATVLESRMIGDPLHLLDCSVIADGAAAVVVSAVDNGEPGRKAAIVAGTGYGSTHAYVGDAKSLTTSGAEHSGRQAFSRAGLKATDVDVAELYDCFTITVLIELEDLGFCGKGEGGPFVAAGNCRLGGSLPTTTHGGLLSAGHPGLAGGLLHVVEGARQILGRAGAHQVDDARVALVHGNGGVLASHCTLLLTS